MFYFTYPGTFYVSPFTKSRTQEMRSKTTVKTMYDKGINLKSFVMSVKSESFIHKSSLKSQEYDGLIWALIGNTRLRLETLFRLIC